MSPIDWIFSEISIMREMLEKLNTFNWMCFLVDLTYSHANIRRIQRLKALQQSHDLVLEILQSFGISWRKNCPYRDCRQLSSISVIEFKWMIVAAQPFYMHIAFIMFPGVVVCLTILFCLLEQELMLWMLYHFECSVRCDQNGQTCKLNRPKLAFRFRWRNV